MSTKVLPSIPLAKPYFSGTEAAAIEELLDRGWVTQGLMVERLEQAVAEYVGSLFAVATSSCTTALHLAMLVHDIGAGHDVICPSYTFIASANAIKHAGAQPQFVDIDPKTLNIDPHLTDRFIRSEYDGDLRNKQTGNQLRAIMIVHQIGIAADLEQFQQLGTKYGIALIEDAACAIGSSYKGRLLGGSGNISCFSFHPRKLITTGEGGMLLTKDEAMAARARRLRGHGASISDYARHHSPSTVSESYDSPGYNYRLTDIQAAIGLKQLELLGWFIERRQAIASQYDGAFAELKEVELITMPSYQSCWNRQSYTLRLRSGSNPMRNAVMDYLHNRGIATRRGIPPIHQQLAYSQGQRLPSTELVSASSLFLPIFPQMTDDQVQYVIDSVIDAVNEIVGM